MISWNLRKISGTSATKIITQRESHARQSDEQGKQSQTKTVTFRTNRRGIILSIKKIV